MRLRYTFVLAFLPIFILMMIFHLQAKTYINVILHVPRTIGIAVALHVHMNANNNINMKMDVNMNIEANVNICIKVSIR